MSYADVNGVSLYYEERGSGRHWSHRHRSPSDQTNHARRKR
ncbi:MAG TPA: hypothetical protein VED20_16280 [Streptosporangiaceae bacterium]|nr:hypothetical protein [Streptosporangiaceae bacterium]